jgi:hypothetical protein
MPNLRSARKIDDMTVELMTAAPDALPLINLTNPYMASLRTGRSSADAVPASAADPKERAKQAWDQFPQRLAPAVKMDRFVPRGGSSSSELRLPGRQARSEGRSAGSGPDARPTHRGLPSGQVDWVEPAPDALPRSSSAVSTIYQNEQPHFGWQFSRTEGSP